MREFGSGSICNSSSSGAHSITDTNPAPSDHRCVHARIVLVQPDGCLHCARILFISSISGLEIDPAPDFGYTAAKAALIAHAKKLAVMHAPQRIRVNAIAPGSTEFPGGVWSMYKEQQPELYETVRTSIPWGRLGTPAEVADLAVFLLSPRAGWVVGECVSVDGGQHRRMR